MSEPGAIARGTDGPLETSLGLRVSFWVCIVIGVAVVVRRVLALRQKAGAGVPPEVARFDAWFQTHSMLTYVHILAALVFLCVLPMVFWARTRGSAFVQGMFYGLGSVVAISAYCMSVYSVGGWVERAAVLFFNTIFLVELILGFEAWRRDDGQRQRRWTLRATATVLGIATTRPVMGVFFATSRLTHWTPQEFFGPAFWIGFAINVGVMELWLRRHSVAAPRSA